MTTFVFDENVVIAATTRTNHLGEADETCHRLAVGVIDTASPHQLAWSLAVYRRWSEQVQQMVRERRAVDPSFLKLINQALRDTRKCPFPQPDGDPPALPGENSWSSKLVDDIDFVRLAAYFRAVLSTYDEPLRREVEQLELDRLHAFLVRFPGECLLLL